jgi:hypothetical protein
MGDTGIDTNTHKGSTGKDTNTHTHTYMGDTGMDADTHTRAHTHTHTHTHTHAYKNTYMSDTGCGHGGIPWHFSQRALIPYGTE